ncbi:MAG: oligopeptide transporter, OPT family [Deltaproteobacteria bacterium]|nr:oligopeptide transporter, OPT family [Deltaproteobacteria bacterium]
MDEQPTKPVVGLPENAFRELKDGEKYVPTIPDEKNVPEVTRRSIVIGLGMAVFFSAAVAYLTLKLGQGLEAAIPIAILAIGLSQLFKRKSTLLENVNIVVLGATSGIIVGGSVFVMPAIYILGIEEHSSFFQIFVVPLLGAVLGVLFLIPFRRYFVAEMHGKLPFPEATATTEVLVAGEKGGSQAMVLVQSMIIGGVYDALVAVRAWAENFTTEAVGFLSPLTHKVKAIFALNTTAAIAGLGYLIGVRYAAMILAGSMLSCFVIVPIFAHLGQFMAVPIQPGDPLLACQSAVDLFDNYARKIGIGAIFAAGIISIIRMLPIIGQAFGKAFGEMFRKRDPNAEQPAVPRIDRDIPMKTVVLMMLGIAAILWFYIRFSVLPDVGSPNAVTTVSVVMIYLVSFLFAAVSAWAIAMISVTPISGMTLTTLLLSALILTRLGLKGDLGMLAMLLIGGVVCTALSMTGSLVTQFKMGYWLGSTPKYIQWGNILASIVSAVVVTAVILLFDKVYGFENRNLLPAPQPNAMAEVARSVMQSAHVPWFLYGIGAVIAVLIEMLGVSALAVALGMYIPIEYNSPIIFGALVAHFVKKSAGKENEKLGQARYDRGLLVSSGLIAGGAMIGVLTALLRWLEVQTGAHIVPDIGNVGSFGNWLGLGTFVALCGYMYWDSWRAKLGGH